ncbi:MAG: 50S ribosomal protein L9 [Patescibacteria group bacterium]|nr:50S ribosomal protein L9 [Patescibacteria group bacterium]
MKVIMLKDVRSVGQKNDIKNVADGYAMNYLLPHRLAEAATPQKIRELEQRKSSQQEEALKEEESLNTTLAQLRGKKISIVARATEKGGLFKSITPADIARAIREEYSLEIPEAAIHLSEAIKTAGEHPLELVNKSQKVGAVLIVSRA